MERPASLEDQSMIRPLFLTVPGLHGSEADHWQRRWERERTDCRGVELGSWDDPVRNTWIGRIDEAVSASACPVVLVAHSLGCQAVAWWANLMGATGASTVLGACGQMFYSMSLAMGITITYGSYMPKENLLEHSVTQIEIFDTLFAFFAGLMIIPAVIAFNGGDPSQVNSGPSLMFISLPMVFDSMKFGTVIGAVFFLLVLFAALTSSIALMETLASVIMDKFKLKRIPATLIIIAICLVVGLLSCLGYGPWESVTIIGMQFLDFFDFISNSVLMPIVAVLTCVLIGHVVGTKVVADEVKSGAGSFHREKLHRVMIRWIAPVLLVAILASELASKIFGVFSI